MSDETSSALRPPPSTTVMLAHDPRVHRLFCYNYVHGPNMVFAYCDEDDAHVVSLPRDSAVRDVVTCLACIAGVAEAP